MHFMHLLMNSELKHLETAKIRSDDTKKLTSEME